MSEKEANEAAFVVRMIRSDNSWEHQERAVYTVDAMRKELARALQPLTSPDLSEPKKC